MARIPRNLSQSDVKYIQEAWPGDDTWTCSECDAMWVLTDFGSPSDHRMSYCPRCGGRIVEEVLYVDPDFADDDEVCS